MSVIKIKMNPGPDQLTSFQQKVYEALCEIPVGRVCTYQELARYIGCGSCQAVGQALKRNPYAPMVPCHRVVRSDRTIGGYYGSKTGSIIEEKRQLLASEGIIFVGSKYGKIDAEMIYNFPDSLTNQ